MEIILLICLLSFSVVRNSGVEPEEYCGYPGSPHGNNSEVKPTKEIYKKGEKIAYTCVKGDTSDGAYENMCNGSDKWIHETPSCRKDLALSAETTANGSNPELAVDGDINTCYQMNNQDPWWQVKLKEKVSPIEVVIRAKKEVHDNQRRTKFDIAVEILQDGGFRQCDTGPRDVEGGSYLSQISCPDIISDTIRIKDASHSSHRHPTLQLCSVHVFTKPDPDVEITCGEPNIPLNCRLSSLSAKEVQYTAKDGYQLETLDSIIVVSFNRTCVDGKWTNVAFRCVPFLQSTVHSNPSMMIQIQDGQIETLSDENPGHRNEGNLNAIIFAATFASIVAFMEFFVH